MKKFLISAAIFLLAISTFSLSFATNMMNDVRDAGERVMNNTEQKLDTMKANGKTDTTVEKQVQPSTNYEATRTSLDVEPTFIGMNSTVWTWLIIGIIAIAIFALIWYYTMQLRTDDYNDTNNY